MGTTKAYPSELRQRAVETVFEVRRETGSTKGAISRVGRQLGVNPETLRNWVRRAEVDSGQRSGTTTEQHQRIRELERENRELRRPNEILKSASAFFARELDPPPPK